MGACGNARKNIQHSCINLSGIGLSGYRIAALKAHLFGNHRIDLINGLLVSVKQLQEAGLGSCRAL